MTLRTCYGALQIVVLLLLLNVVSVLCSVSLDHFLLLCLYFWCLSGAINDGNDDDDMMMNRKIYVSNLMYL